MRVICRDSDNLIEGPIKLLTVDKIYQVIQVEDDEDIKLYFIEDNTGEKRWFDSKRFVDAIPYIREEKLNDLGI